MKGFTPKRNQVTNVDWNFTFERNDPRLDRIPSGRKFLQQRFLGSDDKQDYAREINQMQQVKSHDGR